MNEGNPYRSPEVDSADLDRLRKGGDIPPSILAGLALFGIGQYWALGLLAVFDVPGYASHPILAFGSYFVHWSSVGALVGFAVSKRGGRGTFLGAIAGAVLSAILMC